MRLAFGTWLARLAICALREERDGTVRQEVRQVTRRGQSQGRWETRAGGCTLVRRRLHSVHAVDALFILGSSGGNGPGGPWPGGVKPGITVRGAMGRRPRDPRWSIGGAEDDWSGGEGGEE
jgi:hypothetical protein